MSTDRNPLHPNVESRVDLHDHGLKPMKMSDVQKLAMLGEKARTESGNFTCLHFFKALLFIGVVCTFAFVFYSVAACSLNRLGYSAQKSFNVIIQQGSMHENRGMNISDRIECLQRDVNSLSSRYEMLRAQCNSRPACNCSTPRTSTYHSSRWSDAMRPDWPRPDWPRPNWPRPDWPDHRNRRSVTRETQQEIDDRAAVNAQNEIDSQIPSSTDRFSAHLLPTDGDTTLREGQFFEWTDNKTHSFLQPSGFELIENLYLHVPVAGYYFVYSQITFNDSLTRTIGHQLLTNGRCGRDRAWTILMGTSLTQQNRPSTDLSDERRDSSYLGGVFYLSAGDFLAVRPDLFGTKTAEYARLDSNTFFGAFLISGDPKAPSWKENCNM